MLSYIVIDFDKYKKLLRDPRWQKKRLEIFQRDKWKCQRCRSKKHELHVHHFKYTSKLPWKEKNENLMTLCSYCHEEMSVNR